MCGTIEQFLRDDAGASAVEYSLIAALVSVAAVTALTDLGASLSSMFGNVASGVDGAGVP